MKHLLWLIVTVCLVAILGCSNNDNSAAKGASDRGDHVWKAQENAYRKAQSVPPMLDEVDQRQRRQMEEQGG